MKKISMFLMIIAASAFLAPAAWGQTSREQNPEKQEWLRQLGRALALEKLALTQYTTDSERFNISMPYRTILPQKENQIQALTDIFNMYGISPDGEQGPAARTGSIAQSYRLGMKMEQDLIKLYEWLARNADDRNIAAILNDNLAQSRRNLMLFEHGQRAGQGMGGEMGPGGRFR